MVGVKNVIFLATRMQPTARALALALGVWLASWAGTTGLAFAQPSPGAGNLLEKHRQLRDALANNAYGKPLYLESTESSDSVSGHAYAVLDVPFAAVNVSFRQGDTWCDVMILHINTKYCKSVANSDSVILKVHVGKKTPQNLDESYALDFAMRQIGNSSDLMVVLLNADKGPVGTSDYRIELKATPLANNKTFMHLHYSYGYGMAGKLAMRAYLATAGRSKIGFSRADTPFSAANIGAKSSYVGGSRGAVERNTMRYYLAIDAYLQSLAMPAALQTSARLDQWFNATERYPLQLRETDKASYLAMKISEIERQKASATVQ